MLTFRAGAPPVEKRPYRNNLTLEIETVYNNSSPCPSQLPTPLDSPRSSVSGASGQTFAWSTKKETHPPTQSWSVAGPSSSLLPPPLDLVPAFVIDQPRWESLQKQVSDQGCELAKLAQVAKRHSLENKMLNQKYITLLAKCDKVWDQVTLQIEERRTEEIQTDGRNRAQKAAWTRVLWWLGFAAIGLTGWALAVAPFWGAEHYYTPT